MPHGDLAHVCGMQLQASCLFGNALWCVTRSKGSRGKLAISAIVVQGHADVQLLNVVYAVGNQQLGR